MMRRFVYRWWLMASAVALTAAGTVGAKKADFLDSYKGAPFHDSRYNGGAQEIPGTVMCAYYDLGGEGVAYHDSDAKNNGSGALNPANGTYLNEFRMNEGVDISYTKFGLDPKIDDNPYDKVTPLAGLLYVGWTETGEWFNVTVDVAEKGDYSADLLYTSNRGGTISLDVNGVAATGPLTIAATYDAADQVAWRQWHHWNVAKGLVRVHLDKGRNVLMVYTVAQGQMNYATLEFKKSSWYGVLSSQWPGETVPVWNAKRSRPDVQAGKPGSRSSIPFTLVTGKAKAGPSTSLRFAQNDGGAQRSVG